MTFVHALDAPHEGSLADVTALVGGKAANLGVMARDLGLPVPPGFVIATSTCRAFLGSGWPDGLDDEIRAAMAVVEAAVGRRFGDAADPLLVSVRSGAPVSMPGMMDTILDLGLNDATTAGLARVAGARFAGACRERFETMFRSIVGVTDVPDDPWRQLHLAVEAVFRSWDSDRARAYRRKEGIPGDLGTAVTVQAMVFGNRGPDSATGVLFTRNPATGESTLYGDVLFDAQGEDVVAGTHRTEPVAAIDQRLPAVGASLRAAATRLERHYADLCDIEFTIESGRLWLLQVRVGKRSPEAAVRIALEMAEDPAFPVSREAAVGRVAPLLAQPPRRATGRRGRLPPLVIGLPASPGIASGPVVMGPEAAVDAADHGRPAILVRSETSPDDVHGMAAAAGILTARGGLASHAAVVARGWGIPAVVGAGIEVRDGEVAIGARVLRAGDVITIDGGSGEVFEGTLPVTTEVVPAAATLLAWARELGIPIDPPGPDQPGSSARDEPGSPAPEAAARDERDEPAAEPAVSASNGNRRATPDDVLQAVAIKGFATAAGVADVLSASPEETQPILDQLAVDGLIRLSAGSARLTEVGEARADDLRSAERAAWGLDRAVAALDDFLALDERVKDVVTDWQLRDRAGGIVNDHGDPDYDRAVIERLTALQADALAWLAPHASANPRLAGYGVRLGRALDAAVGGDGRFVASPRVDSYHGIWFELHEDLIRLAGRRREDEASAGRA